MYYALFELFLFTMLLAVTSNNIIIMWVAIEATTLGSAFLVGIYGRRSSLEAAWKYVVICTVGVAFGLYGTVLVYSDAVNFLTEPDSASLWTEIMKNASALDPTLLEMAFIFLLIGFGTKAGIFPMHAWLPDAHSEAPSPVSALLSGVLLNCALFVVICLAGIAVGMATNIPPHNIREICDASMAVLDNPDLPDEELLHIVKGPDFPTAGIVLGRLGIREAYTTGRGRVIVRARTHVEEMKGDREAIIIDELPYQVNKASLIERIAELVKDEVVTDIADIRDESSREGMRVVIILKRDADARVVENQLFKHTQMQITFGIIMLALVEGEPRMLSLKQALRVYLEHRLVVSYGKGSVQIWQPLSNNQGAARVTIAKWLPPDKRAIDHVGLTPDIVVEMTEEDFLADRIHNSMQRSKHWRQ